MEAAISGYHNPTFATRIAGLIRAPIEGRHLIRAPISVHNDQFIQISTDYSGFVETITPVLTNLGRRLRIVATKDESLRRNLRSALASLFELKEKERSTWQAQSSLYSDHATWC
ncbi:hypothetical protein HanHA89_Chr17g0688921 [Helianthus annuus]|nr:hypothetical protein HanHA89_Chr17g0688921 [Helianthus annuus]